MRTPPHAEREGGEGAQPLDGGTSRSSEAESGGGTGRGGGGENSPEPEPPHRTTKVIAS